MSNKTKANKNTYYGGTGITTLLAVAFIVLKLCHVINWSWWLVLLPIIIPVGVWLLVVIAWTILFIASGCATRSKK